MCVLVSYASMQPIKQENSKNLKKLLKQTTFYVLFSYIFLSSDFLDKFLVILLIMIKK